MKKIITLVLVLSTFLLLLAGCGGGAPKDLKDGTYTAIASDAKAEEAHGWKDKLTINVTNGEVTILEFESFSTEDNRKKSEDTEYPMTEADNGTQPSIFFPKLIENWGAAEGDPSKIEAVAGATQSSDSLKELMTAALKAAQSGDTSEVVVE